MPRHHLRLANNNRPQRLHSSVNRHRPQPQLYLANRPTLPHRSANNRSSLKHLRLLHSVRRPLLLHCLASRLTPRRPHSASSQPQHQLHSVNRQHRPPRRRHHSGSHKPQPPQHRLDSHKYQPQRHLLASRKHRRYQHHSASRRRRQLHSVRHKHRRLRCLARRPATPPHYLVNPPSQINQRTSLPHQLRHQISRPHLLYHSAKLQQQYQLLVKQPVQYRHLA